MPTRKFTDRSIRKVTKLGGKSLAVTIPVEITKKLGWREKQKVVVRKAGSGVSVKDWKK